MTSSLLRDLDDLVEKQIVSAEAAENIRLYYDSRQNGSSGRLTTILSLLGALLLGSGIILILAHNWDMFGRISRTIIAFVPLAISQALCLFALKKKKGNHDWIESSSVLLFFAVATCISLIAQIYQINGSLPDFLLTWTALTLPLVYIMPSSAISLLIIALATWYASLVGYSGFNQTPFQYVIIMVLLLPVYYRLLRRSATGNFLILHNWFIVLSLFIVLGAWQGADFNNHRWIFAGYMALAGLFYLLGNTSVFKNKPLYANPFTFTGVPAIIILLLLWSSSWLWNDGIYESSRSFAPFTHLFTYIILAMLVTTGYLFVMQSRRSVSKQPDIMALSPFVFVFAILLTGSETSLGIIIINACILAIGIYYIKKGSDRVHIGILNFGLLILASLAVIRFFDENIPFIWRGIIFIITGVGFFVSNFLILRKKRAITTNKQTG